MTNYDSAEIMQFMGFGKTLEEIGDRTSRTEGIDELTPFYSSMLMVSDALRFPLDAVRFDNEFGLATERWEVAAGVIEPGTVAVVKMRYVGESNGRDVLVNEWVWRTTDDVKPEWGTGEYWSMAIQGDPTMNCRIEAKTTSDSKTDRISSGGNQCREFDSGALRCDQRRQISSRSATVRRRYSAQLSDRDPDLTAIGLALKGRRAGMSREPARKRLSSPPQGGGTEPAHVHNNRRS